jgi:hypothetical protein
MATLLLVVATSSLAMGLYAIAKGNRFKARGRIQLHSLQAEGEVESSPPDEQR